MLDTAIVGAGLCGIALARSLCRQGRAVALFEARDRLGGRILTVPSCGSGLAMDLGPSWFWPDTQPLLAGLIAEMKLTSILQHDDGSVLHLNDPDKAPQRVDGNTPYQGAHRLQGGMSQLVDALRADLPAGLVHPKHVLTEVHDRGDHVALRFAVGDDIVEIVARHVVVAIPPRLLAERVGFAPGLDEATLEALRGAQTWMATQAKVAVAFDHASWREAGQSGNAAVTHEQAVIGEVFDICAGDPLKAALAGFIALSPDLRDSFKVGLPLLIESQLVQLFGLAVDQGEQRYQDWASEAYTCSALDRASPPNPRTEVASPMLRRAYWDGRLYLGGAETASRSAGYLEGALESARRIELSLLRRAAFPGVDGATETAADDLDRFRRWVAAQGDVVFDDYRHRLSRSLASHSPASHSLATEPVDQLTQRALLEAMEDVFDRALSMLDGLALDVESATIEAGRCSLTPEVQQPFGELMRAVLDDVIAFNRSSRALLPFPDEQQLSQPYLQVILRDVAAAWLEFSLSANRLLLAKADRARAAAAAQLTGALP